MMMVSFATLILKQQMLVVSKRIGGQKWDYDGGGKTKKN